jgi:short-subunit dehydrogenase
MGFAEKYGPWAVIAGASEGTGSSFAHQVAQQGVNCILIARREGPLKKLADELRTQHGIECVTGCVDLAAADAIERIAAVVGEREVGLFISNAGADPNGALFLENDLARWDELVTRNVVTVMRSCYHFAGPMRSRGRGGIIIVGSGACYGGLTGITVYSATKAFDLCFGEGLWAELRPHGVDVLNLILGRTDTPAHRELMQRRGMPMPTNLASPDDVAKIGLARLPLGPVHNWALEDDETGYAISSASSRRQRILSIDAASKAYWGRKYPRTACGP